MNKYLLIAIFIITPALANAKGYADMFNIVYRNNLYYSSYIFLKKSVSRGESIAQGKVEKIMDIVHPSVFIHDPELDEFVSKKTAIDYAVAIRRFFLNDFKTAKKKLIRLKRTNMRVEKNYILGLIYLTEKNYKHVANRFKRCVRFASKRRYTHLKPESYVKTFKNRCVQQLARIYFANKDYKRTLKVLDYVRKDDYIWPRFLIDRAWSYYWLGETERSLGSVVTYKAPLLKRFMIPEANYLRGLIYYEMCYFEKAENIYKEFNETTWKYRDVARTISKNRLLRLIISKKEPKEQKNKFLYYYLKGFKKDIRFFSFKQARGHLTAEIKKLSRVKSLRQAQIFLDLLYYYKKAIKEDFQDFLKNVSNDYYLQIRQMRSAFVKLNLMVSLKKRERLAQGKSIVFKDELETKPLGDIPNIDDKFIWDFRGGFWADELGDYAVALQNRCVK